MNHTDHRRGCGAASQGSRRKVGTMMMRSTASLFPVTPKSLISLCPGGCVTGSFPAVPGRCKSLKNLDVGGVCSQSIYTYIYRGGRLRRPSAIKYITSRLSHHIPLRTLHRDGAITRQRVPAHWQRGRPVPVGLLTGRHRLRLGVGISKWGHPHFVLRYQGAHQTSSATRRVRVLTAPEQPAHAQLI